MKATRFLHRIVPLLLALTLVLGSVGFAAAEEPVTLRFVTTGANYWENGMDPIIAAYNESHPNVKVEIEYYAGDPYNEAIEIALGSGSTEYDVIAVDSPKVAEYAENGYTLVLDDYNIDTSIYQAPAVAGCTYNGQLTCLPLQAGISCLYYNKTLLDEAGITLREVTPDNRLTFEEIVEISKQAVAVLDPDGTRGISGLMFGQINKIYAMLQIPTSLGGETLADDSTLEGTIDSEPWRKAAAWYQEMLDSGVISRGVKFEDTSSFFRSGKILFLLNSYSGWSKFKAVEDYELCMTYNPVFAEEQIAAAPTGSWCMGVSAFSKHPAEAVDFLNYLCGGEGHRMWVEDFDAFSAVQADVEAVLADENADYGKQIAMYEASNVAVPRPLTQNYSIYETVMGEYWQNLASGAKIDEAIQTAIETYSIYIQ